MAKYIIYKDTVFGRKHLKRIINKRPFSSDNIKLAKVCESRNLAEYIAGEAERYSGQIWWVQEVKDGK